MEGGFDSLKTSCCPPGISNIDTTVMFASPIMRTYTQLSATESNHDRHKNPIDFYISGIF